MQSALTLSTNPQAHENRTVVLIESVQCVTPGCRMNAENGGRCVHCRNVPRFQLTPEKRMSPRRFFAVLALVGLIAIGVVLAGVAYAGWWV